MPLEKATLGDVAAKDGMVKSHRFLAVNTALPFLRGDTETIARIEEFLRDEKLRVDLFTVRRENGGEVHAPAGEVAVAPGERIQFDVVVRNKGVGHTFPGGTNDSNEGWLEVTVADEQGRALAASGLVRQDGHVDPGAHFYKALMVDRHGEAIHKRNAQDIFAPVYVRVIGPGTADVAHYEFEVPGDLSGTRIAVRARLLWRKFDRRYTEFAFHNNRAGFAGFDAVPDLPVTEIAADTLTLAVAAGRAPGALQDHGRRKTGSASTITASACCCRGTPGEQWSLSRQSPSSRRNASTARATWRRPPCATAISTRPTATCSAARS